MKRRMIEKVPVLIPKHKDEKVTGKAQVEKEYLILDMFKKGARIGRYALNTETGEHAYISNAGHWHSYKLLRAMGYNPMFESFCNPRILKDFQWDTKADEKLAEKALFPGYCRRNIITTIQNMEEDYDKEKRLKAKDAKYRRIDKLMNEIPKEGETFREWIYKISNREGYLFSNKANRTYGCSTCGAQVAEADLNKPKQGEIKECPKCGQRAVIKKRTTQIWTKIRVCKLERVNPRYSVARHYKAEIEHRISGHGIYLDEEVRIILYNKGCAKGAYAIFYNQDGHINDWYTGLTKSDWYTSNPRNKRMGECYLYPEGIQEALSGTEYESVTNAFIEASRQGLKMDYNAAMAAGRRYQGLGTTMEYLAKGRFYKLLQETSKSCWAYNGHYFGCLHVNGGSVQEVMGLMDRQKINRLREENGGGLKLKWLRYSEAHDCKIPKKTMDYLEEHRLDTCEIESLPGGITDKMSIEQIVNYLKKQAEQYYKTPQKALNQWADYLSMCQVCDKTLGEELFYKPRNLKQRHDELVTDTQKLDIVKRMNDDPETRQREAEEMEEKFQKASAVMKEVKEKYEFAADGYRMIMPESPIEIVREGYALHHCAGSSERYFNRIENRETFIGFLRREQEVGIPFYTIEFEPGGTVRQNRSYYDEEPGIEEIRDFLKLWQKEIKKRLTKEDKACAARSAVLREQNIKELQEQQNTFVLKKLEEDFMEAV